MAAGWWFYEAVIKGKRNLGHVGRRECVSSWGLESMWLVHAFAHHLPLVMVDGGCWSVVLKVSAER
jgi:hypothetical protein